jgi:hypothetical protein
VHSLLSGYLKIRQSACFKRCLWKFADLALNLLKAYDIRLLTFNKVHDPVDAQAYRVYVPGRQGEAGHWGMAVLESE